MPPESTYVHVPFCIHRCGYCNFTLVAGRDDLVEPYLQALEQELSRLGEPQPVNTIFLGGGTPTYLRGEKLTKLLDLVRTWHPLRAGGEWSVEANPADLDRAQIAQLRDAGVTRVSLGAQSFSPRKLTLLERDHRPERIEHVVGLIRSAGLQAAVDLIFGVPGETSGEWRTDLQRVLALEPQHVSTYGLTWEKGTTFWNRRARGELQTVDEELERELYSTAIETLRAAGFDHYEVSNFARPGFRCRHNEAYWLGESYYAAGPGAARFVAGVRSINHRSTTTWIKRLQAGDSPIAESETLPPLARARELLVFALRRLAGVERRWYRASSGYDLDEMLGLRGKHLLEQGLLEAVRNAWGDETIRLTSVGLMLADGVCGELLKEND